MIFLLENIFCTIFQGTNVYPSALNAILLIQLLAADEAHTPNCQSKSSLPLSGLPDVAEDTTCNDNKAHYLHQRQI